MVLLELELVAVEDSTHGGEELHLGDVTADTGTGTNTEGDKCSLLAGSQALRVPSLGNESLSIRAPDLSGVVDRVRGNGEDIARLEDVTSNVDRREVGRDLTRKTKSGGAVNTHRLIDDPLQTAILLAMLFQ